MPRSTRETEIKLPFETAARAREHLEWLEAHPVGPRQLEDNMLFDRTDASLRAAGKLLRLRRVGERAVLTFKAPVAGAHRHKVREEHETAVNDPEALIRVLEGLGFARSYRYQKYRTVFQVGELCACLDETPLGCFIELEGRAEDIDRAAERIGFSPEQYILASYRELHDRACALRGEVPGDMLLDDERRDPS